MLAAESSMASFKPMINEKSENPAKKISAKQANNFWERNLAFIDQREKKK